MSAPHKHIQKKDALFNYQFVRWLILFHITLMLNQFFNSKQSR